MPETKTRMKDKYPYVPVERKPPGMHVDPPRQAYMRSKQKTAPALTAKRPELETRPSLPASVTTIGKTKALHRIEDAGLDRSAFSSAIDVMVATGVIQKQGQAFLIPESMVNDYIANSKEE